MVEEKVGGNSLLRINDTASEISLDCDVQYVVACKLNIIDEKDYEYFISKEPLKLTLKTYIDACMSNCFHDVYPNGIEYTELSNSIIPVGEVIKEKIQPVLSTRGLDLVNVQFMSLSLDSKIDNLFQNMRFAKKNLRIQDDPGMVQNPNKMNMLEDVCMPQIPRGTDKHEPTLDKIEWICSCGRKNNSRFCPECGMPRKI